MRRIGLAVTDESGVFVSPYGTRERIGYKQDTAGIIEMVRGLGIEGIIVGLPLAAEGGQGEMESKVRAFGKALRHALAAADLPLEIQWWDERFSTAEALTQMRDAGISQRRGRESTGTDSVDARAAAVILQGFLDARQQQPLAKDQD
jgi:putative Holliday junction resolvase